MDYVNKLEELKNRNIRKLENLKSINKEIMINEDDLKSRLYELKEELERLKIIETQIKNQFFNICVKLKI
jgi:hypothetical protein